MCASRIQRQRGIAIGPILFVIAILAVLAAAISASMGSFSGNSDTERARTYAGTIVNYAATLRAAVSRVMAMGCTDTQINFNNLVVGGYSTPGAPADKHCNLFDVAGAGLLWPSLPAEALDGTHTTEYDYGNYAVYDETSIQGSGIVASGGNNGAGIDLVLMAPFLSKAACDQVNKLLGYSDTPVTASRIADVSATRHFKTYWSVNQGYIIPYSYTARCINAEFNSTTVTNPYIAYFLLLPR